MENKQKGPQASQAGALGPVSPSRTGFTTQRLSLIVENRRRKTWQIPEELEIKTSTPRGSESRGITRSNSIPASFKRQQPEDEDSRDNSRDDSREDDTESVVSECGSDSVFMKTSTPVKMRHLSELSGGSQYSSSPNLSPVSTRSDLTTRGSHVQKLRGLNGVSQGSDRNNEGIRDNNQNRKKTEIPNITSMGRRAYYRKRKTERSPTSRKFEQLLKGDISASLERLSQITGSTSPDYTKTNTVESQEKPIDPKPENDSFLITRSLDSNLNTIHSARIKSADNVSNVNNKAIIHGPSAKSPVIQSELGKETNVKVSTPLNNIEEPRISDSEHNRNSTCDVIQRSEKIRGQGLTTVDSDRRDYIREDANLKGKMEEQPVEQIDRGQNSLQPSATTGLEHSDLFVNTNKVTKPSAFDGNVPASLEIVHNDTTCPNQRYGTKQSLKADSTLQNNADQSGAEKCSNIHHERNGGLSDKNAFTNDSKVAKDETSAYVYDGSLMSPAKHKSPAKLFTKKGPSVFGGFSRLFSRKGKKDSKRTEPESHSNFHRPAEENSTSSEPGGEERKAKDAGNVESSDNNYPLSKNKSSNEREVDIPGNKSEDQDKYANNKGSVQTNINNGAEHHVHGNKGETAIEEVNKSHGSNDSLDSLDEELFAQNTSHNKDEHIDENKTEDIKMKDKVPDRNTQTSVKRSQSVRELTTTEKDNLDRTGTLTGFPLSKSFFQAPVGRSGSLLPSWRRWSSQSNFEALREESEEDSASETEDRKETKKVPPKSKSKTSPNSTKTNGTNGVRVATRVKGKIPVQTSKENTNPDVLTASESEDELDDKFVNYFKRNGKVAIQTDGNKTVVVSNRGSFKNISYNPEFTPEGLQLGTEKTRTDCTQLDLPEEDRPKVNEQKELQEKLKQYRVQLPDATTTESSDVQFEDSLENLDANQNVQLPGYIKANGGKGRRESDQDSVLRDGSISDKSDSSERSRQNKNIQRTKSDVGSKTRSHSDLGLKGYMYNPKHDRSRPHRWNITQSSTDLRHAGDTESDTSSVADTTSSQGYDSEQHNASMDDIRKQLTSMTSHFSTHVNKKKQQRARRGSFGGSDKTPSVSELSVGSSRASRWSRDPTADAKPISNPALKNKLGATGTSGAKVTSKDQKILELMLAKREEAKKVTQKREAARSAWEEEKQREAQARSSAENARRRTLSEHRRLQENRRAAEAHARLSRGDEVSQSMDALNRKLRDDEDSRNDGEESLKFSVTQWSARCNRIMAEKEAKLAEKRRQNMERKKSAEERLQAKLREEKERNNALLERQERQLRRASSLKESKEAEQVMQRRTKSAQYKKKQEENKSAIERRSREDLSNLKSHIDSKLNFAGDVTKIQQQRKTKDLRKSMYELDARLEKSRENQQRMEEELGVWRDDLKSYRKMMDQKAEEQARQNVLNKKKKAMQERIAKERAQKENMKKLMQQEEEWKMDVEATLAMKDARARVIQMEKEEMIEESRKMAHASQRLREELRNAYSSDHIDQLSRRAELEAKIIGNPIPHTTKNMSNLNLG